MRRIVFIIETDTPFDRDMSTDSTIRSRLTEMDPHRFEEFVADIWALRGWNTELTTDSGDEGIDIDATRHRPFTERQLIQVKRYQDGNRVGSQAVQQYASLQLRQGVDAVVIVTTSDFTDEARSVADDLNVKLVTGSDLHWLMKRIVGLGSDESPSTTELIQWILWMAEGLDVSYVGSETVFLLTSDADPSSWRDIDRLVEGYTAALDVWGDDFLPGQAGWSVVGVDAEYDPIWSSILPNEWGQRYLVGDTTTTAIATQCRDTRVFESGDSR